jgi:two-component system, LytTR family, sensor kinase
MTLSHGAAPPKAEARAIRWGMILAIWTVYGLITVAQQHVSWVLSRGIALPWWKSLVMQMPIAYGWALMTPVILWLGRRFPLNRERWPTSVAVHLTVCLTFVWFLDLGYAYISPSFLPPSPTVRPVLTRALQLFVGWVLSDGLIYWMVLILSDAVERQRRLRERELTASQLETQLAQADLQALKMQLHPHFLFNALHTIGSLVRTGERDDAVRVVARLGDLLRGLLDGASSQEVPLRQELEFIGRYLEIEQIRFRDRLTVTMSVDSEVLDASVPHLILQPLVENAIRHGISPHRAAGRLLVSARRVNDRLQLRVQDDGPGADDAARPGIGLSNTRARLNRLYGDDYELEVGNAVGGGLEARIGVPFRLTKPAVAVAG